MSHYRFFRWRRLQHEHEAALAAQREALARGALAAVLNFSFCFQELEYSLATGHLSVLGPCLDDLRFQVEEREKEIATLRQAALEKERQIEQLNVKYQNQENIEQYCKFVSLDPVAEVDEGTRDGKNSPTPSEEPSTPTTPLVAEVPADVRWIVH
ncbi:Protein of unknown function [Gryllus bimaculatus]|nr:Protein of unknown function [Gryllus bimaculatus]